MYCTKCNENIGYLCYSTYDKLKLKYQCKCGSNGNVLIDFIDSKTGTQKSDDLILIKNRYCCPKDNEPLITILENKMSNYELSITCKSCNKSYRKKME